MILYMKTTTDKFELPIAVEETVEALASDLGLKVNSVKCMCSKQKNGYHRIKIEEEQDPDGAGQTVF